MRSRVKKDGKGVFLKGAVWIAVGGFTAKLIGALYRIPLTNLIGGKGLGLYQLIYPIYCLLLTVSATGIPSSIAKLTAERIAQGKGDKAVFYTAMKLFTVIGLVGALLMMVVAPFLAKAQGSEAVLWGYYTLAPSVLLVSAISVFRGWFQGRSRMFPTALSEVVEQVVKVVFGLVFAYLFRDDIYKAVVFLLLAVSISEMVTLLVMWGLFRRSKKRGKTQNEGGRVAMKSILRLSIPVTFNAILLPISGLLDSVLAPRLLRVYTADAVTLFGLFSGGAVTVINLPVSICYGFAAASIPRVAMAVERKGKNISPRRRIFFSLGITAVISGLSAIALYLFAEPTAELIFRSLAAAERTTLIQLIKTFSVSAFTLSCVQTLSACLTAQGKPQYAALSMWIALTVKTGLYVFWLRDPTVSVFGLVYATNIAYAVAFLLDLLYNVYITRRRTAKE